MPRTLISFALVISLAAPAAAADADRSIRKAFGIEKRVLWTNSNVVGFPEPPPPYRTERVFPKLSFSEPLDVAAAPDSNRLWVAERKGKLYSFIQKAGVEKADLALELIGKNVAGQDVPQTIYGFTFHPDFKINGYVFVTWIPDGSRERIPNGTRVSRFTAQGEPPLIARDSEKVIIEWPNGGHNGGCLKFGPDGYLYIATGDGSGIADELQTGQKVNTLLGKLLRIDVDRPETGEPGGVSPRRNYSIPKDNPFVATKRARPEIYAYGLRQLWRFSFDRVSGDLWGGEIGQDLWEMVLRIEKGGNYGWSVQEGTHPFRPERPKGPTPILRPVAEHPHSDFRSITGGYVYHGSRLPELRGAYIYGDFDTGRIWGLQGKPHAPHEGAVSRSETPTITSHRELARTTYRIVSFGQDAAGEIFLLDFTGGGLHQLVKAPPAQVAAKPFPKKLSETGIFASTKDHQIAPGIIPYSVNAQLWSDHATKERFIAIPGEGQIGFDEVTYPQPSPGAPPGWRFPDGTVLVKTFSMEMERGNPASSKRLETRLLHFQKFPGTEEYGDQYWRGYTYLWNDAQTDAELLDERGLDRVLKIKDGEKFVEQNYRFPSRAECTLCHTMGSKFALGVTTMQMNRDHLYPPSPLAGEGPGVRGILANQLATLEHIGLFEKPLLKPAEQFPKLADYEDESQSLDTRARAYLHSNCAHCHIKWGGGNAEFKLVSTLPLEELGITNVPPGHGAFGISDARLLVPAHPERSILLHRMSITSLGRMPHIGSRVPHESAIKLIREWIKELPAK